MKIEKQPKVDLQVRVVKSEEQVDRHAPAVDNDVPAADNVAATDNVVVVPTKVKRKATKLATVSSKVKDETTEITFQTEDLEVQFKVPPARKSKDVANRNMAMLQSSLAPFVQEVEPPPPSKAQHFKIVKLRYMQSDKFRLPVDLVKDLKVDQFPDRHVKTGVFKLRPDAPFWDHGKLRLKFGFSPYINRVEPTPAQCLSVWNILNGWLRTRDPPIIVEAVGTTGAQGPAHGNAGITVDCLVRTIMAQATANKLALTVQSMVSKRFTYTVNGEKVEGKLPNYHTMRIVKQQDLEKAIRYGGLYQAKASTIQNALNAVYKKNVELVREANGGELPADIQLGQEPNQPDFVPGMLSMDFLRTMSMAEIFCFIEGIPGIGHKTAACILEFNYGFPICAVDIHVNKMARLLGWVPQNSQEIDTFRHLEGRIPDHLKHLIHQAFWHHPQNCARCKLSLEGDAEVLKKKIDALEPCPLDHLLTRFVKPKAKPVARKEKEKVKDEYMGPKASLDESAFKSAEEAAENGYEAMIVPDSDDFAAGSVNVGIRQMWVYTGDQEE